MYKHTGPLLLIVVSQSFQPGSGARCARHRGSEETLHPWAHARILGSHQPASIVQIAFGFTAHCAALTVAESRGGKQGPSLH